MVLLKEKSLSLAFHNPIPAAACSIQIYESIRFIERSEVLTVITMKITIFWDVTSCSLIQGINLFYPENGTSRLV
jgi:hypothetical protein